jgi:hypothetical protein
MPTYKINYSGGKARVVNVNKLPNKTTLQSLDRVYLGQPFVNVVSKFQDTRGLDTVYKGQPFYGHTNAIAIPSSRISTTNHPDVDNWLNTVALNGGSASSLTIAALNTFCNSIESAGLRNRFHRLNLFCGNNLASCLVPLYNSPSSNGIPFGFSLDINTNFLDADYTENSGLKGNGTSKYLLTGLPMTFLGTNQLHLYCSFLPDQNSITALLAARFNLAGSLAMESVYNSVSANRPRTTWFGTGNQPNDHCNPLTGRTQYLCNFDGTQPLLVLGRNINLNNVNNAISYSAANNETFLVFAGNQTGTGITGYTTHRIDAYSIGAAFTSSTQRNAFHDAMNNFRIALGRT